MLRRLKRRAQSDWLGLKMFFRTYHLKIIIVFFLILQCVQTCNTVNTGRMVRHSFENIETPVAEDLPNEYEPREPTDADYLSVQSYIDKYSGIVVEDYKTSKILPSIKLAQAIIESRQGNSRLAVQNNNHFGIKCFSNNCKKGHCTNHHDDHHKDFFRKYKTVEESFISHSHFLKKKRYKTCFECGKDYECWARKLKSNGYATDKKYPQKLIGVIESNNLYKYDK